MKVLIEIDERMYKALNSYPCVYSDYVDEMFNIIRNGTPLNGTNGEVLMKMFPPSVYFPSDGKYMALLTKDCIVSCSNVDWWNADYKEESGE